MNASGIARTTNGDLTRAGEKLPRKLGDRNTQSHKTSAEEWLRSEIYCHLTQRNWAQLLGSTHRIIRVKYDDSNQKFSPRKLFPICPKTLGDYLLLKRVEADLSQLELARKTGVTVNKIKKWEHDQLLPTNEEWRVLEVILPLKNLIKIFKPNIGV